MHVWKKIVRTRNVDSWTEKLGPWFEPERFVIVERPHTSSSRIEVYFDLPIDALPLQEHFGGAVSEVPAESWQPGPTTLPGKPLVIGKNLVVTGHPDELPALRLAHPARHVLCIPAAMAFGTGEHATTAMCARLLLDVACRRSGSGWDLLDLGTGSGILALAGRLFGANHALGVDNDPQAVRTARENAKLNGIGVRSVRFERVELPEWPRRPNRTWPVVTANLFSELLIRLLPGVIAPAVAPGGDLILSGVLATQADEVVAAVRAAGLELAATKRRGRWRAFHCRKSEGPRSLARPAPTLA